jgi:hypothetical protein
VSDNFKAQSRQLVAQWPLLFAPGYGYFDPDEIEKWMHTSKERGVNHFLFDHFHYALEDEDQKNCAKLIQRIKTLTKQLDVHMSLIVQPKYLREGQQLGLDTLRGGAAIGQALDNLLILERVKGNQANISRLKLDQARHKLATLGEIYLMYNKETTGFEEVIWSNPSMPPMPRGVSKYNGQPWPRVT